MSAADPTERNYIDVHINQRSATHEAIFYCAQKGIKFP